MSTDGEEQYDVTATDQNVEGDIGVSSGRQGDAGPGQHAATGSRDTSADPETDDTPTSIEDQPHEQNSQPGLPPKGGFNKYDPRNDEAAYEPGPQD